MQTITNNSEIVLGNYKIVIDIARNGNPGSKFYQLMTSGKNKGQWKQLESYYFRNEEHRNQYVANKVKAITERNERVEAEKKAKKELSASMVNPFKIGDVVYGTWGYDQTNVDFYQIVEVKPKSCVVRRIGANAVPGSEGMMCNRVTPAVDRFISGPELKKIKVYSYRGDTPTYSLCDSHCNLSLYTDGNKGTYCSWYA